MSEGAGQAAGGNGEGASVATAPGESSPSTEAQQSTYSLGDRNYSPDNQPESDVDIVNKNDVAEIEQPETNEQPEVKTEQPETPEAKTEQPETEKPSEEKPEQPTQKELNKLFKAIKEAHPDREFASDDDFYDVGAEFLTNLNQYKTRNTEANKKLVNILKADKQLNNFLRDITAGATSMEAFARNYDVSKLTPVEGDPDYDAYAKNVSDREAKIKAEEERANMFAENKKKTFQEIDAFVAEHNLNDDQADEFLKSTDQLLNDVLDGKVSKEFLSIIYKGYNHDKAVEQASAQSKIAGRNEAISEKIEKAPKGDNLPKPNTSNKSPETKKVTNEIFDIVDNFNKQRSRF